MKTIHQTLLLAAGLALPATATQVVVDDFLGGPHVVTLSSSAPPEIALGSFGHGGAVGGVRDAAVWSVTPGFYTAGVAFNSGGYASFAGKGKGGVVWDGVAGITDANADNQITGEELDFGLDLDLSDCEHGVISLTAFADLPTASLRIILATDAANFSFYDIALTGPLNAFNPYSAALSSPSATTGTLDLGNVNAIALFIDASNLENLDVRVSDLLISCPDGGWSLGTLGLGLLSLGVLRHTRALRRGLCGS